MFEFQTAMSELTGLPVSNAALYEGPSAVASAGYLAKLHNGGTLFVVSAGLHPHTIETLRTYAHGYGAEVVEVRAPTAASPTSTLTLRRSTVRPRGDPRTARTSTARSRTRRARRRGEGAGALLVVAQVDPMTLGILGRPASAASTSPSARASRSATASTSEGRRSASSPRARSRCGGCPDGSPAKPRTSMVAAASC